MHNGSLTDEEVAWISVARRMLGRRPIGLSVYVDLDSNGELMICSENEFTPAMKRWLARFRQHLNVFPTKDGAWLLANDDGLNVGKGSPKIYSYTVVGPGGAMGGMSDTFQEHYLDSLDVDDIGSYGASSEEFSSVDWLNVRSGNLSIQNINGHPPMN